MIWFIDIDSVKQQIKSYEILILIKPNAIL